MPSAVTQFSKAPVNIRIISSGLQRQVVRLPQDSPGAARALVVLADGDAVLADGSGETPISGPTLCWRTGPAGGSLMLEAGATGIVAEITDEAFARAVGDFFESAILQSLFAEEWDRSFTGARDHLSAIVENLTAMAGEIRQPRPGSAMMIIARLRIILVTVMRASGMEATGGAVHGEQRFHLQRFRQLVEAGFRAHRSVTDYARELGISADRLHAICTRELGKPPKALIAERVAREASIGLERSTLSIKQLSYALGFKDPAHFSHFFRRMVGVSPGRFRRMLASSARGSAGFEPPNFSDWP